MPVNSFSLLRHPATPQLAAATAASFLLLRRRFSLVINASRKVHNQPQPNRNTLKAREALKHFSSLTSLSPSIDQLPQILSPNQAIGMVASAQANFMRVIVQSAPEPSGSSEKESALEGSRVGVELLCVVRALLKKIRRRVMVGDKVLVGSIDWVDRRGMIENVYPRESEILDPPIANADHFLVLFSMDQPKLEPFSLTRFLVEAESTGIPLTLALNKCELVNEEVLAAWKTRLFQWGYVPIFCSVKSKQGLDSLVFTLRERTTVIVGPSGVGKSSLINVLRNSDDSPVMAEGTLFDPVGFISHVCIPRSISLCLTLLFNTSCASSLRKEGVKKGNKIYSFCGLIGFMVSSFANFQISGSKWFEEQRVGEVSARSGRGKHTTRNVSLLPLAGGGYLADTPGFNQPRLLKVTKHSLAETFPEIRKILKENEPKRCAFNNCLHIGEPGCLVGADWERYPYYFQLVDEIKIREEFQLRTMGTKREADVRTKMGHMGVVQAEPKLEPKKHRRLSRKKLNQSILDELYEELDEDDEYLEDNPIISAMDQENQ